MTRAILLAMVATAVVATGCDGEGTGEAAPQTLWDKLATRQFVAIDPSRSTLEILVGGNAVTVALSGEIAVIREGTVLKVQKIDARIPRLAVPGGTLVDARAKLGIQLELPLSGADFHHDASGWGGTTEGYSDLLVDAALKDSQGSVWSLPTRKGTDLYFSAEAGGSAGSAVFTLDFTMPERAWESGTEWPSGLGDGAFHLVFTVGAG